jgi:hypothetical protein
LNKKQMSASERYGRKGREVTKGNYEKNHFSSSGSDGNGRDGSINGERRRAVFLWDPGAGGDVSGARNRGRSAGCVCSGSAGGLRAACSGGLCAAGGVFSAGLLRACAESLLPARTRGSVWF